MIIYIIIPFCINLIYSTSQGELFFYIICGFFSLVAVFSLIVYATDRKPTENPGYRDINQDEDY